jgi:hypothetical protein
MKLFPIVFVSLFKDRLQNKHDAKQDVKSPAERKVQITARTKTQDDSKVNKLSLVSLLDYVAKRASFERIKFSFHKDARLDARKYARNRKKVLQTVSEPVSDKQLNLEAMVAELEQEDAIKQSKNQPVSQFDLMIWIIVKRKHEADNTRMVAIREEHKNRKLATEYFANLKQKNYEDASFLRKKTFKKEIEVLDLQDVYEKTKNTRSVVNVFNSSKEK